MCLFGGNFISRARQAIQIGQHRPARHDVGVFRIHVEQVYLVRQRDPVGDAVARDDRPEAARDRVAGGRADTSACRIADDDRRVNAESGQHRLQMGAVEGAREFLHQQMVGRLDRQPRVDSRTGRAVEQLQHERDLLPEHPRIGEILVIGDGREDHGGSDPPRRRINRLDTRHMRVHVDIHLARFGDAATHVDHENGRPVAKAHTLAETDLVIIALLLVDLLQARSSAVAGPQSALPDPLGPRSRLPRPRPGRKCRRRPIVDTADNRPLQRSGELCVPRVDGRKKSSR